MCVLRGRLHAAARRRIDELDRHCVNARRPRPSPARSTLAPVDHDQHIDDRARTAELRLPVHRQEGQLRARAPRLPGDATCSGAAPTSSRRSAARSTRPARVDPWVPKVDDPATRGGKYVSMVGDDGVRYYFAHLESVAVDRWVNGSRRVIRLRRHGPDRERPQLGAATPTSASRGRAHGPSGPVRRGEIWPWKYLDAWRDGRPVVAGRRGRDGRGGQSRCVQPCALCLLRQTPDRDRRERAQACETANHSTAGTRIHASTSNTIAYTAKLYESSFGGLPHAPMVSNRAFDRLLRRQPNAPAGDPGRVHRRPRQV